MQAFNAMEEKKKDIFLKKLKSKYRLVVLNDSSFEEKFSLKLTPLNLFTLAGSGIIIFIVLGICLVTFTPLREYIPGYADVNMRRQLISVVLKTDSLEKDLKEKSAYVTNINNIINDKITDTVSGQKPLTDSSKTYQNIIIRPSKEDSLLRHQIEEQDKYSLLFNDEKNARENITGFFFFTPLNGLITSSFSMPQEHYGIDVVARENEAIKATLDGTVISADWTLETGYTIQIQHDNNLVSIYKHNSALLKKPGQFVKAGEVIAVVGNTGERTTGPHMHFELWYNGTPIDPQDYMVF